MRALDTYLEDTPVLRGALHAAAFYVFLPLAAWLWWAVEPAAQTPVLVYLLCQTALLGVSGLYHRGRFTASGRRWMRRLDHSMIFGLIGGTMTPLALLACDSELSTLVLQVVWFGVGLGVVMKIVWLDAPDWASTVAYVICGCPLLVVIPELHAATGWTVLGLLVAGSVVYLIGGVVYVVRRPDPIPEVFGFHEVFHGCTLVGFGSFFAAIALIAT